MMMQMPAIRARMAAQRAESAFRQAETEKAGAETSEARARENLLYSTQKKTDQETAGLTQKGQILEALQNFSAPAVRAIVAGKLDDPSVDKFLNAASAMTGENKDDIMGGITKGMSVLMARQGNVQGAADILNPVSVANKQAELAAKVSPGAKPPPPGVVNSAASKISDAIRRDVTTSQQIPEDAETKKPYPLLFPRGFADKSQKLFTDMVGAGVPLAEATPDTERLMLGTNGVATPDIVTNRPATPGVHHTFSADEPPRPAVLGTNSYTLQPGGADQEVVQDLAQRSPTLAALLAKNGFAPSANARPAAGQGSAPIDVSAEVTPVRPAAAAPATPPASAAGTGTIVPAAGLDAERAAASASILKGKNPEAVRALFKQRTGMDL